MPAIIPADSRAEWLDPEIQDEKRILPILSPYTAVIRNTKQSSTSWADYTVT